MGRARCPDAAASRSSAAAGAGRALLGPATRLDDARFADPRFAGQQHHPACARTCLPPAAEKQLKFLFAADQRNRAALLPPSLEAASPTALTAAALGMPAPARQSPLQRCRPEITGARTGTPSSRRVLAATTDLKGLPASACRRAARLGVSPTTTPAPAHHPRRSRRRRRRGRWRCRRVPATCPHSTLPGNELACPAVRSGTGSG